MFFEEQDKPRRLSFTGVRGWLWFICVTLVILNPLQTLNYYLHYNDIRWDLVGLTVATRLFHIDLAAHVPLTLFSVYAGLKLWRVRPGAVRIAKLYLYTHILYAAGLAAHLFLPPLSVRELGDAFLIALVGNSLLLTPGSSHYLTAGIASYFGSVLVAATAALLYLKFSLRVRRTYTQG